MKEYKKCKNKRLSTKLCACRLEDLKDFIPLYEEDKDYDALLAKDSSKNDLMK